MPLGICNTPRDGLVSKTYKTEILDTEYFTWYTSLALSRSRRKNKSSAPTATSGLDGYTREESTETEKVWRGVLPSRRRNNWIIYKQTSYTNDTILFLAVESSKYYNDVELPQLLSNALHAAVKPRFRMLPTDYNMFVRFF